MSGGYRAGYRCPFADEAADVGPAADRKPATSALTCDSYRIIGVGKKFLSVSRFRLTLTIACARVKHNLRLESELGA